MNEAKILSVSFKYQSEKMATAEIPQMSDAHRTVERERPGLKLLAHPVQRTVL